MKKFEEYQKALNTEIEPAKRYENLTETEIVAILGGRENYNRLNELNYPINEGIVDFVDFFDGFSVQGFTKRFTIELIAGLLNPLAKKLNIQKGTFFWYVLVYGTQHALYELGESIFNQNKKNEFCRAFAVGVIESTKYWLSGKVVNKLMKILGFKGEFTKTTMGINISNHAITSFVDSKELTKFIQVLICDKEFADVNGKKKSLWDMVIGMGEDTIKGVLRWAD